MKRLAVVSVVIPRSEAAQGLFCIVIPTSKATRNLLFTYATQAVPRSSGEGSIREGHDFQSCRNQPKKGTALAAEVSLPNFPNSSSRMLPC